MNREAIAWTLAIVFGVTTLAMFASGDSQEKPLPPKVEATVQPVAPSAEEPEAERNRELERQREAEELQRMVQQSRKESRDAVARCSATVRARTDSKHYKGFSNFDAFVSNEANGTVRYFGSPAENFQFDKCMAERGHPLSKPAPTAE